MKTKGKLGPAFHTYLEYLESVEAILVSEKPPKKGKTPIFGVNQSLFKCSEADMEKIVEDVMPVDAYLAGVVRSSVKYRMDTDVIMQLTDKYREEITTISTTTPIRLPHEWCTLIMEGFGPDTFIVVAQEQTLEQKDSYPELGVEEDEKFICLNICTYKPGGSMDMQDHRHKEAKLSHVPVEIHCKLDQLESDCNCLFAGARGIEMTDEGRRIVELVWNSFLIWIAQFQLQGMLRNKTPGALPTPGTAIRRHKKRKKIDHPQFEHTIIRMEIDAPEPGQTGMSFLQSKKRMHLVRGYWRTLRSGKCVWVKGHWRGDEKLGVIRRDVELVTHEEEGEAA